MQNEAAFIALDTVMMTICTGLQTFVHPGLFFPAMTERLTSRAKPGKGESFGMDGLDTPPEYKAPAGGRV